MLLTICIPTHNRSAELNRNLKLLSECINRDHLQDMVCVLISDNASSDDTPNIVSSYVKRNDIMLKYCRQDNNVGLANNFHFIVKKAETQWVMLLGDDDYLEPWYIAECIKQIECYPNLGCIIPNYVAYYPESGEFGNLREENCKTEYYKAGFDACLMNAWRAHQLSG